MATLPNERSKPLPRLAIYRDLGIEKEGKRKNEALALVPLILKLDQILEIDDVEYAADPPDFAFKIGGESIGVELTDVNPALFGTGGYLKKKEFREWEVQIKANPQPVNVFTWGKFTLRESIDSLRSQFADKCEKAKRWPTFDKKWLLLHLAGGSPFGDLVANDNRPLPGKEEVIREHIAKILFEVCSVFAAPNPFDYVLMFSGCQIIAFPANGQNPHKLPMPRWDYVTHGARANDDHLSWSSTLSHVTQTGKSAQDDPLDAYINQR